ncbi:23S rRNA (uracil(1939)-C(5))-methyltransferase RlmD [Sulfobacillus harzensis]|uniref:23S rRNA (Uracil(1939)-C(5))-methyltransferase RlmD n=1 Tax=Sulfobacillus harzensis TaxID=2729629 RepID=A0A7Y0Q1X9_9FIRM|nr:23S rRNA (uracil(1939)-C(5))-methyltransferase RlmD [Sulfobacillus harzensis]NMP22578.1 23S rRNA (uracil(1939)-C(5))-methyltransferase RlmD [Sulfobacillus harzensis]
MADNNLLTVEIERMGQAGDGVGRMPDGRLIFIPGGLPGELVRVRVIETRKNFARGALVSAKRTVPTRVAPVCPIFGQCGGCAFQHWDYGAELAYKENRVREALTRIAQVNGDLVEAIRGCPDPYGYRNKGQFPFGGTRGKVRLGLYRRGTHEVIGAAHCAIQDPWVNELLQVAEDLVNRFRIPPYDETQRSGILRHLLIRSSRMEQKLLALLVVTEPHPELASLAEAIMAAVPRVAGVGMNVQPAPTNRVLGERTVCLAGQDSLIDSILGLRFRMSYTSFFQVNPGQVEVLYRAALNFLPGGPSEVWDLYSGVGTLAALAAREARWVRALEVNPEAVHDARENFALNHLTNVGVEVGRVEDVIDAWVKRAADPPGTVIVDPPRAGLDGRVVERLNVLKPGRIIYISCNPDTWARDVGRLSPHFQLMQAIPVDMFPRTDHVEVASWLARSS